MTFASAVSARWTCVRTVLSVSACAAGTAIIRPALSAPVSANRASRPRRPSAGRVRGGTLVPPLATWIPRNRGFCGLAYIHASGRRSGRALALAMRLGHIRHYERSSSRAVTDPPVRRARGTLWGGLRPDCAPRSRSPGDRTLDRVSTLDDDPAPGRPTRHTQASAGCARPLATARTRALPRRRARRARASRSPRSATRLRSTPVRSSGSTSPPPRHADLQRISEEFSLDPLAVEDAVDDARATEARSVSRPPLLNLYAVLRRRRDDGRSRRARSPPS